MATCGGDGLFITSINMAHDACARITGQHSLQPFFGCVAAIGYHHHTGVDGVSHPYTATMMHRNPAGSVDGINEGIKNGPIGNGIAAILHGFSLPVGGGHRTTVQMIAANDNESLNLSLPHQLVDGQAKFNPFAIAQPANPRGQALEGDLFSSHLYPTP